MKKIFLTMLVLLLVTGCNSNAKEYEEKEKLYIAYWEKILNNDKFIEIPVDSESFKTDNYTLTATLTKGEGSINQYTVILDKPYQALYDVKMLVVDNLNDISLKDLKPSIGILDSTVYNMIPNQTNKERGYVSALSAVGDTTETELTLYILVSWSDITLLNTYYEYYSFPVKLSETAE